MTILILAASGLSAAAVLIGIKLLEFFLCRD